jgi:hypothetical protein
MAELRECGSSLFINPLHPLANRSLMPEVFTGCCAFKVFILSPIG